MGDKAPSTPPDADISASRGLDFYTYINHDWQRNAKIMPYDSSFSVSDEIETRVENSIFSTIDKLRKTAPDDPFAMLVNSILIPKYQINSVYDLQRLSNLFDCMNDAEDVGRMIGRLNRIQTNAPLSFIVANDRYIPNKRCVYIYEPKLGLPEKHLYTKGPKTKIILEYTRVLRLIGSMLHIEGLENAVKLETSLIPYLSEENDREDAAFSYKSLTIGDLKRMYTYIPWTEMMLSWGIKTARLSKITFILTNEQYIQALNRMFRVYSMQVWRIWMRAQVIVHFMKYLPPPFDDYYFGLWGKMLQGTTEKTPQRFLMLNIVKEYISHNLGEAYVKSDISPKLKETATKLVQRLRVATLERIRCLKWMSNSTKKTAIEKCKTMIFQIAYPDKWVFELDTVKISETRMLTNMLNLAQYDTEDMLEKLGTGKIDEKNNWDDGVFEVNAYYYSDKNMMVIPAGILQAPFFDLRRSEAWNLGGIGAAIGHEITHGFDDDGRLYDKTGVMKHWWTEADTKTYKEVTRALVDLFNKETYMGGKVDGELTLSENIADLGGISIALEALENVFKEMRYDERRRKAAYKEFFTSYAVSWRNKDRPKKAQQSLVLDKHAPAPLRVNLIVRQFAEFYAAFDIQDTDPGYIPADERIQLW